MKRTVISCFVVAVLYTNLWAQPGVEPVSRLNYWGALEHIAVAGDYAFASNPWGLLVFNVSDPTEPILVDNTPIMGIISSLKIQEDILYVSARSFPRFDVSDPENMRRLPDIDGFTPISVQVGDYAYSYGYERLYTADITNPDEPVVIDTLITRLYATEIIAKENFLICLSERYERVFTMISIQNPEVPEYVGDYRNDLFRERETLGIPIQLINDQLYLTTYATDGLRYISCFDFSNPAEPNLRWDRQVDGWYLNGSFEDVLAIGTYHDEGHDIIFYSTENSDTLIELGRLNDRFSNEIILYEDIMYSVNSDGLDIYNAEEIDGIESLGAYRTYGIGNFTKIGDYLYAGASDSTIRVISVENIQDPHEVARVEFDNWRVIRGEWEDDDGNNYLITFTDPLYLKIIQVDGEQLTSVSEIDIMPEGLEDYQREYPVVDVWDGGIVVGITFSDREDRLIISQFLVVSLEQIDQPEIIGTYLWEEDFYSSGLSFPYQIKTVGDFVYIPAQMWINDDSVLMSIEDPTQPEPIESGHIGFPIVIEGDLMVAGNEIYNIEDPANPERLSVLEEWEDDNWSVSIQHGLVIMGGWAGAPDFINFRMYNVRDPNNPILITELELPGSVYHTILDDGVIYVGGSSGIEIMQYTGADGVSDQPSHQPVMFELSAPYPNPFNSTTLLRYSIQQPSDVSLTLYDTAGRLVNTLINGQQSAGSHELRLDGSNLTAGVYVIRLIAGESVQTQKVVLLK